MAEVPLVDLEVIVRYSLAIRQERAPAEEVLAALDESRALVLALLGGEESNGDGGEPEVAVDTDADAAFRSFAPDEGGRPDEVVEVVDVVDPDDVGLADQGAGDGSGTEDEVALDDLDASAADVRPAPRAAEPGAPPPSAPRGARLGTRARRPAAEARPEPAAPAAPAEDQAWTDEVERIRQRRLKKARAEAEERQARQADLADKARRAKRAEEARRDEEARDEQEAKQRQQQLRADRGTRAPDAAPPRASGREAPPVRERASSRGGGPVDLDEALELPPPLPADEAARRRAERRKRRSEG